MSDAQEDSVTSRVRALGEKEYLIFLDESEKKGAYYSNFYGGVMVGGKQY